MDTDAQRGGTMSVANCSRTTSQGVGGRSSRNNPYAPVISTSELTSGSIRTNITMASGSGSGGGCFTGYYRSLSPSHQQQQQHAQQSQHPDMLDSTLLTANPEDTTQIVSLFTTFDPDTAGTGNNASGSGGGIGRGGGASVGVGGAGHYGASTSFHGQSYTGGDAYPRMPLPGMNTSRTHNPYASASNVFSASQGGPIGVADHSASGQLFPHDAPAYAAYQGTGSHPSHSMSRTFGNSTGGAGAGAGTNSNSTSQNPLLFNFGVCIAGASGSSGFEGVPLFDKRHNSALMSSTSNPSGQAMMNSSQSDKRIITTNVQEDGNITVSVKQKVRTDRANSLASSCAAGRSQSDTQIIPVLRANAGGGAGAGAGGTGGGNGGFPPSQPLTPSASRSHDIGSLHHYAQPQQQQQQQQMMYADPAYAPADSGIELAMGSQPQPQQSLQHHYVPASGLSTPCAASSRRGSMVSPVSSAQSQFSHQSYALAPPPSQYYDGYSYYSNSNSNAGYGAGGGQPYINPYGLPYPPPPPQQQQQGYGYQPYPQQQQQSYAYTLEQQYQEGYDQVAAPTAGAYGSPYTPTEGHSHSQPTTLCQQQQHVRSPHLLPSQLQPLQTYQQSRSEQHSHTASHGHISPDSASLGSRSNGEGHGRHGSRPRSPAVAGSRGKRGGRKSKNSSLRLRRGEEAEILRADRTQPITGFVNVKGKVEGFRYATSLDLEKDLPIGTAVVVEGDRGEVVGTVLAHISIAQMIRDCEALHAVTRQTEKNSALCEKAASETHTNPITGKNDCGGCRASRSTSSSPVPGEDDDGADSSAPPPDFGVRQEGTQVYKPVSVATFEKDASDSRASAVGNSSHSYSAEGSLTGPADGTNNHNSNRGEGRREEGVQKEPPLVTDLVLLQQKLQSIVLTYRDWPWVVHVMSKDDMAALEVHRHVEAKAFETAATIASHYVRRSHDHAEREGHGNDNNDVRSEDATASEATTMSTGGGSNKSKAPPAVGKKKKGKPQKNEDGDSDSGDDEGGGADDVAMSGEAESIHLVDVEYHVNRQKLTLYVSRPSPDIFVDFRRMQRKLYRAFRCRIWMAYMDEIADDNDNPTQVARIAFVQKQKQERQRQVRARREANVVTDGDKEKGEDETVKEAEAEANKDVDKATAATPAPENEAATPPVQP